MAYTCEPEFDSLSLAAIVSNWLVVRSPGRVVMLKESQDGL